MSPAVSKKQAAFMRMVESGKIKKKGLSPAKAAEFVEGVPTKDLPEKVKPVRFSKLKKKMTGLK